MEARNASIEEGAGRPAAVLVHDVRRTAAAFAEAAANMPLEGWRCTVRYTAGQEPRAAVIVPSRLAEVLIHHVDLDIGYCSCDWPVEFVYDMLPRVVDGLNDRAEVIPCVRLDGTDTDRGYIIGPAGGQTVTVAGPEHELLAWLLGRSGGRLLSTQPEGSPPAMPAVY